MQFGNIYKHEYSDLSKEIFEIMLDLKNAEVKFERIISNGQATPKGEWYDQATTEWVVLLRGAAGLRFENIEQIIDLNLGDFVVIEPHEKHRVEYTASDETIWLALHY